MIRNRKGMVVETLLIYIIVGLTLLFVPNPLSTSLGVGLKPNKTVQTTVEKVDLIKDKDGNVIATKTTKAVDDKDIQQHITFWEWLRSLPIFVLVLMGLGIVFPPLALFLHNLWSNLKRDTKNIVVSVDKALGSLTDPAIKTQLKDQMSMVQDTSTKNLVDSIQGKT